MLSEEFNKFWRRQFGEDYEPQQDSARSTEFDEINEFWRRQFGEDYKPSEIDCSYALYLTVKKYMPEYLDPPTLHRDLD